MGTASRCCPWLAQSESCPSAHFAGAQAEHGLTAPNCRARAHGAGRTQACGPAMAPLPLQQGSSELTTTAALTRLSVLHASFRSDPWVATPLLAAGAVLGPLPKRRNDLARGNGADKNRTPSLRCFLTSSITMSRARVSRATEEPFHSRSRLERSQHRSRRVSQLKVPGLLFSPSTPWPRRDSPSTEETNFRTIHCGSRVTRRVAVGPRDVAFLPTAPLSTAAHVAVLEETEENKNRKGDGELPKSNPSTEKTNTRTNCKSCVKSKQQTFQERVKCDPKYSIRKSQNATFPWEA